MSFKSNHAENFNALLQEYGIDIHMKDTILRKNSSVINECLRRLIKGYENEGSNIPMYVILLSIDSIIGMDWFVNSVLDDDNRTRIRDESINAFGRHEKKSDIDMLNLF